MRNSTKLANDGSLVITDNYCDDLIVSIADGEGEVNFEISCLCGNVQLTKKQVTKLIEFLKED